MRTMRTSVPTAYREQIPHRRLTGGSLEHLESHLRRRENHPSIERVEMPNPQREPTSVKQQIIRNQLHPRPSEIHLDSLGASNGCVATRTYENASLSIPESRSRNALQRENRSILRALFTTTRTHGCTDLQTSWAKGTSLARGKSSEHQRLLPVGC